MVGFKNVIFVKDLLSLEEDFEFSFEDVCYLVVCYVVSIICNVIGLSVSDLCFGEIIESDIIWYYNYLCFYCNCYLLEIGVVNFNVCILDMLVEDIGEMMKMVIVYEIGYVLGLFYNMKVSVVYFVDFL